jgi:gamma-glutamylcyclotransferase (GGCT)/AIG2-like uncharacterized protein YtfP
MCGIHQPNNQSREYQIMLYFAYGSNLHQQQMKRRCPDSTPLTRYDLPGWELVFRSVADIVRAKGKYVAGAIYEITKDDERALDRYEGVAGGLYLKKYIDVGADHALVYVMSPGHAVEPPGAYYLAVIEQGYLDWDIPLDTLAAALQQADTARMRARQAHKAQQQAMRI